MFDNISMEEMLKNLWNANFFANMYKVEFIVWSGNVIIFREQKLGSENTLKRTFNQLISEIRNENTPMKCRMEIPKTQYSTNKDENVEVIDYVEFKNKCMIQAEKESTS
jgi:hypothetical protein